MKYSNIIKKCLFLFFLCPGIADAAGEPQRLLLALSKADRTLSAVDPATLKVLFKVPVGEDPHEVVASDDGKKAFVSNTGSGRFHEINIVDLVEKKAQLSVDTFPLNGPHGLEFRNGKLWFTAEGAKVVGRLDVNARRLDWIMGTGQNRTHMIQVSKDEKKVFVTNVDSGSVSVFENVVLPPPVPPTGKPLPDASSREDWIQNVITLEKGVEGFDLSPDGKELWTATPVSGRVYIVNTMTKKQKQKINANIHGANRLRFTPDGKLVLISSLKTGDLFIYDALKRKLVKKLNLGTGAAGILIEPNGERAFVGCTQDNYVAVVDLKKFEVTGKLDVGAKPDGLAWAIRN